MKSVKVSPKTHGALMDLKKLCEANSMDETIRKALIALITRTIIDLTNTNQEPLVLPAWGLR